MKLSEMKQVETQSRQKSSYDQLKGCSEQELMEKLSDEIRTQKDKGVFDYNALCGAIEQMRPYLATNSYENMKRIIESFK